MHKPTDIRESESSTAHLPTTDATDRRQGTTRRTFLGWLGAATGLAVYSTHQIPISHAHEPTQVVPPSRSTPPSPTFVVKNESDRVMIVHYARTSTTRMDRAPVRTALANGDRHPTRAEAFLLPGEELTITAVQAQ